jgi:hypothetical protein
VDKSAKERLKPLGEWSGICSIAFAMKRAAFKVHPSKGGWIRTTIAPINDRREATLGLSDVLMFMALVVGTVAVARVLLAH